MRRTTTSRAQVSVFVHLLNFNCADAAASVVSLAANLSIAVQLPPCPKFSGAYSNFSSAATLTKPSRTPVSYSLVGVLDSGKLTKSSATDIDWNAAHFNPPSSIR
jgi:hypothetical protein